MKGNMIQMITGSGAWEIFKSTGVDGGKALVGPDAELSYLTVLNEVQAYIDGIKK